MQKALKKQAEKVKRLEPKDARHIEFLSSGQVGHRRSMGSFASTTSLYQNAGGQK
jgi:hypothetical protein